MRPARAQLADTMGASQYSTVLADDAELREHYAGNMAAFMASAIVDLSGLRNGQPLDKLAQAIEAFAPDEGLFADRFRDALRAVTAAQLGERRAHQWHDLKLSRHAQALYWHFRRDLIAHHPELLAVGAGR